MKNETISINVASARSSIASWLSGYSSYQNLPGGVGSGTYSAAQNVANKLYDFLTGVENQLKVDKNLLDKMII